MHNKNIELHYILSTLSPRNYRCQLLRIDFGRRVTFWNKKRKNQRKRKVVRRYVKPMITQAHKIQWNYRHHPCSDQSLYFSLLFWNWSLEVALPPKALLCACREWLSLPPDALLCPCCRLDRLLCAHRELLSPALAPIPPCGRLAKEPQATTVACRACNVCSNKACSYRTKGNCPGKDHPFHSTAMVPCAIILYIFSPFNSTRRVLILFASLYSDYIQSLYVAKSVCCCYSLNKWVRWLKPSVTSITLGLIHLLSV